MNIANPGNLPRSAQKAPRIVPPEVAPNVPVNTVTVSASPEDGGEVTGGGTYTQSSQVTVIATPTIDHAFTNWTYINGLEASNKATYSFVLLNNTTLIANFEYKDPTAARCDNCRYYRYDEKLTDVIGNTQVLGRCYFEPPVYIGTVGPSNPLLWEFPGVRITDFCSRFVALAAVQVKNEGDS